MNLISRIPTPVRWILLGLSFPIGGLIVWSALGPATALGLAIGSLMAAVVAPLLGSGILGTLVTALISGVVTAAAQLVAGPPLARPLWLLVRTGVWVVGWIVSLFLAINVEQGFIVFGSTGALMFAVALFLIVKFGSRKPVTA
jgi:hypothetical protein